MMHSLKKRVGYYLILLTLVCVFTSMTDVNAAQKGSGTESDSACEAALFSGDMLKADSTNKSIKVYAKEGKWKIKYAIEYDSTSSDYSRVISKNADPTVVDYVGGSTLEIPVGAGNAIFIVAEPVADKDDHIVKTDGSTLYANLTGSKGTTTCKAGEVTTNKSNKITINDTAAYLSKKFKGTSNVSVTIDENAHPEEYAECVAMQLAKLETTSTESYLSSQSDIDKYNAQMKKSFPYCYGSYSSSFEIKANTIKSVRKKSLKVYKQYLTLTAAEADNSKYDTAVEEIKNDGYKELSYSKKGMNVEQLSCTKDQLEEKTVKYYTRTEEVSNNICSVTCQEQIQITYDPPVATKAGLCFQYKVTVKSKVTCKTILSPEIDWPTPPTMCDFSPICEGDAQETQAGPTEEFDACITKCDGGKYSQSCINKCYKKVYENTSTTSSSATKTSVDTDISSITSLKSNSENMLKLNNSNDPYYQIDGCKNNSQIKSNVDTCAEAFYKLKQKEPMGKYVKSTKYSWYNYDWKPDSGVASTSWSPSDDEWIESIKRSSPYYFRTKAVAKKTIQSFYGVNNGTNGYGEARTYIIDNGGIKRQRTSTYNCSETCGFVSDSGTDCISSNSELREYYNKEFSDIEAQLSKCTTSAVCTDGEEATFDMTVDNDAMDEEEKEKSTWDAQNKTTNASNCYTPTGDIKMFIPLVTDLETGTADSKCDTNPNGINGTCYGKDNPSYWQHYKTTITFPGTWINLKTGKRVYQTNEVDKDIMREKENYYCVGYDYEPVNEQWWDWKINQNADLTKVSSVKVEKNDNITAKIENFGKYSWNISLNCFYALSNKVKPTADSSVSKEGECSSENSTALCNAEFRPVSQQNLFPSSSGTGSRAAGFNWTNEATDETKTVADTSYGIKPGDYAERLQKEAATDENIPYTGTADYSLHLTKDNIDDLRNHVKQYGYTSYQGNNKNESPEGIEGLYYYTSDIIEKYTTNFKRNTELGKNND